MFAPRSQLISMTTTAAILLRRQRKHTSFCPSPSAPAVRAHIEHLTRIAVHVDEVLVLEAFLYIQSVSKQIQHTSLRENQITCHSRAVALLGPVPRRRGARYFSWIASRASSPWCPWPCPSWYLGRRASPAARPGSVWSVGSCASEEVADRLYLSPRRRS